MCRKAVGLMGLSLLLGLLVAAPAARATQPNPGVLPPDGRHYGRTYGEWGAAYWQWLGAQTAANELACGTGPTSQVWFLGGALGGEPITLACTVPAGTALFVPIITGECSEAEGDGTTDAELRACAIGLVDSVTVAEARLDGVAVQNARQYRVESPLFTLTLPEDNLFGDPASSSPAVADGYWLLLAPLSPGKHTVYVHGVAAPPGAESEFEVTVTYDLTVTAPGGMPGLPNTGGGRVAAPGAGPGLAGLLLIVGSSLVLVGRRMRRRAAR